MRRLFILLLFLPMIGFGQNVQDYDVSKLYLPKEEGKVVYQAVIDAPEKTADALYTTSRLWFLESFKSSKDVIQYEEREAGIIAGNGNFPMVIYALGYAVEVRAYFSVRIEVKDNKFRYRIDNISIDQGESGTYPVETYFSEEWMFKKNGSPKENSWKWYAEYEKGIIELEESIKTALIKPKSKIDGDW